MGLPFLLHLKQPLHLSFLQSPSQSLLLHLSPFMKEECSPTPSTQPLDSRILQNAFSDFWANHTYLSPHTQSQKACLPLRLMGSHSMRSWTESVSVLYPQTQGPEVFDLCKFRLSSRNIVNYSHLLALEEREKKKENTSLLLGFYS